MKKETEKKKHNSKNNKEDDEKNNEAVSPNLNLLKTISAMSLNSPMFNIGKQWANMNPIGESAATRIANDNNLAFLKLSGSNIVSEFHKMQEIVKNSAAIKNLELLNLGSNKILSETYKSLELVKPQISIHSSLAKLSNSLDSYLKLDDSIYKLASHPQIGNMTKAAFLNSSNIGKIAEYSMSAEKIMASFNRVNLGSMINLDEKFRPILTNTLKNYSNSFSELWKSYETSPETFIELRPNLLKIPPIEFYNTSTLIENILVEEIEDQERETLVASLYTENEETLDSLLPKIDPGLLKMWIGAKQVLQSSNIDKTRHFTVSLRELFTHVLNKLSPDNEVKKWTGNPNKHIINDRPTRKARLLYIFRDVTNPYFNSFIDADIKATLKFIDLFQEGTHSIESKLTEKQLFALKNKVESTLKYLLQTHYETK